MEEATEPDDVAAPVQGGHHPRRDPPAGHRVARARRRLVPVGDDLPAAVRAPPEIGGGEDEPALRGPTRADGLVDEAGVPVDDLGRDDPLAQEALLPVEVGQHPVQQERALPQADLERGPLGGRDEDRDRVDLPAPDHGGRPRGTSRRRRAVAHAVVPDEAPGLRLRAAQTVQAERVERIGHGRLVLPYAGRPGELVGRRLHPASSHREAGPVAADDPAVRLRHGAAHGGHPMRAPGQACGVEAFTRAAVSVARASVG